jgi:hypothetical protein
MSFLPILSQTCARLFYNTPHHQEKALKHCLTRIEQGPKSFLPMLLDLHSGRLRVSIAGCALDPSWNPQRVGHVSSCFFRWKPLKDGPLFSGFSRGLWATFPNVSLGGNQVGPNIWLGRAWIDNPVKAWQPYAADPLVKPLVDAAYPLENATFMAGLVGAGLEGPASGATTSGGNYSQLVRPFPLHCFSRTHGCIHTKGGERGGQKEMC